MVYSFGKGRGSSQVLLGLLEEPWSELLWVPLVANPVSEMETQLAAIQIV